MSNKPARLSAVVLASVSGTVASKTPALVYIVSVHNVRLLRYARQKNAHLPHVNSAFFDFASLPR